MKKFTLIIIFLACASSSTAILASQADDILGVWQTEKDDNGYAHVEIYKEKDRYFGKMIWFLYPIYAADDSNGLGGQAIMDIENPDESLRSRPLINLVMLKNFVFRGSHWTKGSIYDAGSGKTYKSKIKLDKKGNLRVRGYVGVALMGRTTVWTPVTKTTAHPIGTNQ